MNPRPAPSLAGRGLFTGAASSVSIHHAETIVLEVGGVQIPALVEHVQPGAGPSVGRSTTLTHDGAAALTVEHLLAACAGLGRWNVRAAVQGAGRTVELPIDDGSAQAWVHLIDTLGPSNPPRPLRLSRPVRVEGSGGSFIEATPSDHIEYRYELRYPAGLGVPDQDASWDGSAASFRREIAPARTFCLEHEARAMRDAGLFSHLTPRDMLVIAPDSTPIDNALRFADEPARHKLLDLIGDLALLGGPLIARVVAHKAGHALTHALCREIRANSDQH